MSRETLLDQLIDRVVDAEIVTLLAVSIGVVLVDTLGRWALAAVVGVGTRPLGVVVVLTAVTVGASARWGVAGGLLGAGFLVGDWSGGVVHAIAAFVAVVVCARLWERDDRGTEWFNWIVRYEAVAVVCVVTLGTTSAWLTDLLGQAAFTITVVRIVAGNLPLAMAGAPLAWLMVELTEPVARAPPEPVSTRTKLSIVATIGCWAVCGYVGSFLFRAAGRVPSEEFGQRFVTVVEVALKASGAQGTRVLFLMGVVALSTLAIVLRAE